MPKASRKGFFAVSEAGAKLGKHIIALSDNKVLIRCIVACCKFMILKEDSLGEYPLKDVAEFNED